MPRMKRADDKRCVECGGKAILCFRNEWLCDSCLNPDPSPDYLVGERERMLGAWGGVSTELWYDQ